MPDFRQIRAFGLHLLYGLRKGYMGAENNTVGVLERADRGFGKMVPLQTYGVQTEELGSVAGGTHVGGPSLGYSRPPPDDGITTHADELMNGYQSSNDGEIFHFDMPSQGGGIGHNDLVSHPAIMGDMGISHDEVAPAQDGFSPSFRRGPIDAYEFPNYIVTADDDPGRLTPVAQVLWRCTDGNKRKYVAPFT